MARIEWIQLRLNNWALWKERSNSGGLGFSSTTSFLHEATTDRYRESWIPTDDVDAELTDQAVESLLPDRSDLYATLYGIYIAGSGVVAVARNAGVARSTIYARLDQADLAIASWFRARSERQAAAKRSFTT